MNRRHCILRTSILCGCIVAISSLGCRNEPTTAQSESARPSPEKSFTEVVDMFTKGIEVSGGSASGFVAQSTGASTRFQVHNTVTSKLIPPTKPDDPFRGTITVSSQSIYSLRRSAEDEEKKAKDEEPAIGGNGPNAFDKAAESGSEFQSFDQGLVAGPTDDKKPEGNDTPIVQRRPDKVDRVYDLVYQGGRWELITKLDPKTEAAVENAFERALRLQP